MLGSSYLNQVVLSLSLKNAGLVLQVPKELIFAETMATDHLVAGAPPKLRSKTKSRNGCVTCKLKRLKCDEQKPSCLNCRKKNIDCGGYATRYKWRLFNDGKDSISFAHTPRLNESNVSTPATSAASLAEQTFVKMEPSGDSNLLLKQHMEMTSLSVLGKSMKAIKMENELLARGINPETYEGRATEPKKMRRSFSYADLFEPAQPTKLQRSLSTNSQSPNFDIQSIRSEYRKANALESLAEAAIDEIKTRSPMAMSPPFTSDVALPGFPKDPETVATPKEWLFNGNLPHSSEIPTPNGKDTMSDLNLTPSLTALINYVFTANDEGHKGDNTSIKLGALGEVPLSPLDLTVGNGQFDIGGTPRNAAFRRGSLANSPPGAVVPVHNKNLLLYDVGTQLMKYEPPSPSISSSISNQNLMKTSENEQILFLYSTYTCGIMSIKAGPSENPWRNIFIPLATNYSYLFNSIASMTLFHLAGNSKIAEQSANLRSKGYFYMKKCILELASGLSKMNNDVHGENQLPADIALTTCLNLAVSESWDTHTSSGIAHLKGAKSMIQKVLTLIKQHINTISRKPKDSPEVTTAKAGIRNQLVLVSEDEWSKIEEIADDGQPGQITHNEFFIPRNLQLLFNEWIYFEVLSQMTSHTAQDDKGIDLVATITKIIQTTQKKRDEESRESRSSEKSDSPTHSESNESINGLLNGHAFNFFENLDIMLNNNDYVDPLLGCAQSLFLIMGRVANLISKVRKAKEGDKRTSRNSLANISLACELKQQLTDWKANVSPHMVEMTSGQYEETTWDIYSCVATAEAYRYGTLLYLHQAVPEIPLLNSHQLAEKIFVLMASIPTNSNLHIIHIFPLLVSSCEAEPGEEREWCEARWALMSERLWIGNIDRALEVVKEVWRRKDEQARKARRDLEDSAIGKSLNDAKSISLQINGLMAALGNENSNDELKGITSKLHWSSVMREWGWEVLLA